MKIEDAIKRYESWAEDDRIDVRIRKEHRQIADWLKELNADRPQGKWEIVTQGWHSIRRCSNCKWTQSYSDPKYMGYEYNYCPSCGARMKGADNGENIQSADE